MVTMMGFPWPGGRESGTNTLIWKIPETIPGAEPAYRTSASTPATCTLTGCMRCASGLFGQSSPVTPGGFVAPPPVPKNATTVPRFAGFDGELRCAVSIQHGGLQRRIVSDKDSGRGQGNRDAGNVAGSAVVLHPDLCAVLEHWVKDDLPRDDRVNLLGLHVEQRGRNVVKKYLHSGEFGGDLSVRPNLLEGRLLGSDASASQRDNLSAHNGPFDEGSGVLNRVGETGAAGMIWIVDEYLGHKVQVRSADDAWEIGRTGEARQVDRSPAQSDDAGRDVLAGATQIGGSAKLSIRAELCREDVARPTVAAWLVGARVVGKSVRGRAST